MTPHHLPLALVATAWLAAAGSLNGHAQPQTAQAPARDAPAARPPAAGTGSIRGTVALDASSAAPIRRAIVRITNQEVFGPRLAITDEAGRFAVEGLPAGRYLISVAKGGYLDAAYGARTLRAPGRPIVVADGQRVTDVVVRLQRGAAITGRVMDQQGLPVPARVTVVDRKTSRTVAVRGLGLLGSDDRGIYRVHGLPAGSYVISVTPSVSGSRLTTAAEVEWVQRSGAVGAGGGTAPTPGAMVTYAPVYAPGTTDLERATTVTLRAGDERSGVDVTLELVRTSEVRGRVQRADGGPVSLVQVLPVPQGSAVVGPAGPSVRAAGVDANGEFVLNGLLPGRYTITARASSAAPAARGARAGGAPSAAPAAARAGGPPAGPDLFAIEEITVTGDPINGLSLVLQPGLKLAGRLVFEATTTAPPAKHPGGSIRLSSAPGSAVAIGVSTRVSEDGTFALGGLLPGAYLLSPSLGATASGTTWMARSAMAGGRNILDTPLDLRPNADVGEIVVTFTDRVSELSGRVTDQADRPAPEFFIVVFSTDPERWFQNSRWLKFPQRPSAEGRYVFTGLPAGEYYLAALPEYESQTWHTPEFLEQVATGAIKVTIGEGEKKTQDVKLGI